MLIVFKLLFQKKKRYILLFIFRMNNTTNEIMYKYNKKQHKNTNQIQ